MNKILMAVIGAAFTILFAVGSWWVKRAEAKFEIVDQLQFRSIYLNGTFAAAPVATPAATPVAAAAK